MGNRGFLAWLRHRWKLITVRDGLYFRFIWVTAILITFITARPTKQSMTAFRRNAAIIKK